MGGLLVCCTLDMEKLQIQTYPASRLQTMLRLVAALHSVQLGRPARLAKFRNKQWDTSTQIDYFLKE